MIITTGVEMKNLCRQIKKVLKILDIIFEQTGNKLIIKGTRMGFDKAREAHESGRAIDIEAPLYVHITVLNRARLTLGINYIVRQHETHLHVEWSPMPKECISIAEASHRFLERSVKKS